MSRLLDEEEVERQLLDLAGWRREGSSLRAAYQAPDFRSAVRLVTELADEAEQMDHHPDVDLRWRTVVLRCSTHSEGGVTQLDVELAHRAQEWAVRFGATPVTPPRAVAVVVDVTDPDAVRPFWREALGYLDATAPDGSLDLQDAHDPGHRLRWRTGRDHQGAGRFRVEVHVSPEQAGELSDRLVRLGGRVDRDGPTRWVAVDAEGNECLLWTGSS